MKLQKKLKSEVPTFYPALFTNTAVMNSAGYMTDYDRDISKEKVYLDKITQLINKS